MKVKTRKRNKTKNKRNAKESQNDMFKFAPLVANQPNQLWRANQHEHARLFWAILSLILSVTFGDIIVCRSPALAFSAAIHFAMKRSARCFAVLRHSPFCPSLQSSTGQS